jgi:hypothetical protein
MGQLKGYEDDESKGFFCKLKKLLRLEASLESLE